MESEDAGVNPPRLESKEKGNGEETIRTSPVFPLALRVRGVDKVADKTVPNFLIRWSRLIREEVKGHRDEKERETKKKGGNTYHNQTEWEPIATHTRER
jgi:hypothetical protein